MTSDLDEVKAGILKTCLEPLGKIFKNEVSFVLVVILVVICAGIGFAFSRLSAFAEQEIPKHIEAINLGHKIIADKFSSDLEQQRKHYEELRKLDMEGIAKMEKFILESVKK